MAVGRDTAVPGGGSGARSPGQAIYAADSPVEGVVHAVVVDSSVGLGRITGIDTSDLIATCPGLRFVLVRGWS
jgi:CO/xanthine dehydrogenase Mo-binding subunit